MFESWILLALGLVLGPPILAIVALSRTGTANRRLNALERAGAHMAARLAALEQQIRDRGGEPLHPTAATQTEMAPAPEPTPVAMPDTGTSENAAAEAPSAPPAAAKTGSDIADASRGFEAALASRWLVWLGAIAIALAGTFLVKFAIDNGWLGPVERVSLGFALGAILAAGGEWLRRRPLQRAIANLRPDHVPAALTASGLFVAFASLYAAYALYDLMSPPVAFAALAAVAMAAVGLALLQGRLVALLGLLGAFATPALIEVDSPSAWLLFSYLLPIEIACLALARYRAWWWYAGATLAGVAFWALFWMGTQGATGALVPLGLFMFATFAGCLAVGHGHARSTEPIFTAARTELPSGADAIGWAGALTVTMLMAMLVLSDRFGTVSLLFIGGLATAALVLGHRRPAYDALPCAVAAAILLLMVAWPMPESVTVPQPLYSLDGDIGTLVPHAPLVPAELTDFAIALTGFAALFGLGGFIALWGARRPALWAGLSAIVPVLLLVIAFWRIVGFSLDIRWAVIALAMAAASLFAAGRVEGRRGSDALDGSLGFYAAAVVGFISLGAAMSLKQAWLTVALSLQLPALGWIARRVPATTIRYVAAAIASVVLVRLAFNPRIVEYPLGDSGIFSWILYGYGIPAMSFFLAAILFRDAKAPRLVTLLQAGGLAFGVLLVSWQIRYLVTGPLDSPHYGLLEQSLQTIAWLSTGFALWCHARVGGNRVSHFGARILLALAGAQILLGHLLLANPLFDRVAVGAYPVANLLGLAYLVPGLFAIGLARAFRETWPDGARRLIAPASIVLLFVYLTLEIKHAFQGPILAFAAISSGEVYAYSAGWLAFAGALLAIGIARRSSPIRHAALAVLLIAVVKVFGFDMADLTGLYRVASFLGLGLSLVGIGYLYQRFVFRSPPAAETPGPGAGLDAVP
jgi:uncharacterized membrane protein